MSYQDDLRRADQVQGLGCLGIIAVVILVFILFSLVPYPDHKFDRYCNAYHHGIAHVSDPFEVIRHEGAKVYHTEVYAVHTITCGDGHQWNEDISDEGRL